MMKILRDYEKTSGQLVNNDKSSLYVHEKVPVAVISGIRRKSGMGKGSFPFTYLGCPVFYGRRRLVYYDNMIKKVMNRVMSWQNRLLSFGGRYILIAHVFHTMPVYLLSTMNSMKGVIDQLHKIFAKYFWSNTTGVKGKHWVAWDKMCLPKHEGGLRFSSLYDISKALFSKLKWNFRTSISLWEDFMGIKYCKKLHSVIAQDKGSSHVWKKMVAVREEVEHQIWWQLKADNELDIDEEIEVKEFISGGKWNLQKLQEFLAAETVGYIKDNISPNLLLVDDKSWWMGETNGFNIEGLHLQEIIILWWKANAPSKLQGIFQAIPAILLIPPDWPSVVDLLTNYKLKLHYRKVRWKTPQHVLKRNTDESSQGNPGLSSYGFCIRNDRGNLVYAQAKQIGIASNMMAETAAIQEAMKYCLANNL
ncbi:uncharacterized protein LOC132644039 [Lycium barbarum]|uniref:uncharacterized protein LOC132644039 n=1 Tax=Lycium barbarum TaxID=112863 RepID=UPI00293E8CE6|nr:uncharacterized protein LOC132644039 [Lycium barbarum]